MSNIRAILVAVDYLDLLTITLPWNRPHFNEVCIVTSQQDEATQKFAASVDAKCFVTDAFYDNGAVFNKWKALELGLDAFGRHGLLCIMDADILWPRELPAVKYSPGYLYTPPRRVLSNPADWRPDLDWGQCPVKHEHEFAGYTQIFHATDPHLGRAPWHQTNWRHAGGADSFFQRKWPKSRKSRPPFTVLHLGDPGQNWCGRATPYVDGTRHPHADQRVSQLRQFIDGRVDGPARFNHEKLSPQ